jgi:hypothetical protein
VVQAAESTVSDTDGKSVNVTCKQVRRNNNTDCCNADVRIEALLGDVIAIVCAIFLVGCFSWFPYSLVQPVIKYRICVFVSF